MPTSSSSHSQAPTWECVHHGSGHAWWRIPGQAWERRVAPGNLSRVQLGVPVYTRSEHGLSLVPGPKPGRETLRSVRHHKHPIVQRMGAFVGFRASSRPTMVRRSAADPPFDVGRSIFKPQHRPFPVPLSIPQDPHSPFNVDVFDVHPLPHKSPLTSKNSLSLSRVASQDSTRSSKASVFMMWVG